MADLLTFSDVSLYPDDPFGISKIDLSIKKGKKQLIYLPDREKLKTLLGLLEGRYRPQSGVIRKFNDFFIQSDRQLMGDKVYTKTAERWLALGADSFFFDGRQRSKFGFIEQLKAKHILHLPIHKLRGEEKTKITLLSLLFQGSGLILVSKLFETPMEPSSKSLFSKILTKSGLSLVGLTTDHELSSKFDCLNNFETTSLQQL